MTQRIYNFSAGPAVLPAPYVTYREVNSDSFVFNVDGLCAQTNKVFEFNGCYWHKHKCELTRNMSDEWKKDQKEKYESTLKREKYLKDLGYDVESIWE